MNIQRWGRAKLFHRRGQSVDQAVASRSQSFIPSLAQDPPTGVSAYEVLKSQGHARSYTGTGRLGPLPYFPPEAHPAFKALYPNLPQPKRSRRKQLSTDLHYLTLSNEAGKLPFCEDVADRNGISISSPIKQKSNQRSNSKRQSKIDDYFSNLRQHTEKHPSSDIALHAKRQTSKRNAKWIASQQQNIDEDSCLTAVKTRTKDERPHSVGGPILRYEERRNSLSRKPNMVDLRTVSETSHVRSASLPANRISSGTDRSTGPSCRQYIKDKPLPPLPADAMERIRRHRQVNELASAATTDSLAKATYEALAVLSDTNKVKTTDTTVYRRRAPAVTHETISTDVHEITEEQTVREVRQDHYHHRTQPVLDIEILPARHLVPRESGGYAEISESDIPAGVVPSAEWIAEQVLSRLTTVPPAIASSELQGFDGTSKESVDEDGSMRRTPIFKPAIQGETTNYPIHFTLQDLSVVDTLRETYDARPGNSNHLVRRNQHRQVSRDEKFPVL